MMAGPSGQNPPPPSTPPPSPQKRKFPSANATELKALAKGRLKEAQILYRHGKFDGAAYMCGYAIELALKARICRLLKWSEYKHTREYDTYKTHDLAKLLDLSGIRQKINVNFLAEWSAVFPEWGTELRYAPLGHIAPPIAADMIEATKKLLKVL